MKLFSVAQELKKIVSEAICYSRDQFKNKYQQKKSDRELKYARAELKQIISAIHQTAYLLKVDKNFVVKKSQVSFIHFLGFTPDEFKNLNFSLFLDDEDGELVRKKVEERLKFGKNWSGELPLKKKDGSFSWFLASIASLQDETSDRLKYIVILIDIAHKKDAEVKLIQSAKMSSLGEMAGGIAHEINNPLTIISGKAAVLRGRLESGNFEQDKIIQELKKIEATALRISKIIKGLKTFSRNSDSDPMSIVNVSALIEEVVDLCSEKLKTHNVDLRVIAARDLDLECKPAQIAQVLLNLISNADDAIQNLDLKWIEIEAAKVGKNIEIRVVDSGDGISDQIVNKIMEPFFTTKDVGKGTGLGLSLSKSMIESHRGTLTYNKYKTNTSFLIRIPARQPQQVNAA